MIRSLISVLLLVLVSWGVLTLFNALSSFLGLGWMVWLVFKCVAIAVMGGTAGLGLAAWSNGDPNPMKLSSAPFVAIGPFVATVHFLNYVWGAPAVGLMTEVAAMVLGAFALHALLTVVVRDDEAA